LEGYGPASVENLAIYSHRLGRYGISAERCYGDIFEGLAESVYLMDCTDSNMRITLAAGDAAKAALDPFLHEERLRERLRLFVLADNSD
jgi:hypothetical protein